MVGVDQLGRGARPGWAIAELACAAMIGTVFVNRERAMTAPMLPVDLFRRPVFALSVGTSICSFTAQTLAYVSLPFLFEDVGRMSQISTGLLITPSPAMVVFVAPLAGRLSDLSSPGAARGGGAGCHDGGHALAGADAGRPSWIDVVWGMLVCGFGFGFFQSPNNRLLLGSAPPERSGGASGMLSTARLLGQTNGSALVALTFGLAEAAGGGIAGGVRLALALGVAASALATVVSLARLRQLGPVR